MRSLSKRLVRACRCVAFVALMGGTITGGLTTGTGTQPAGAAISVGGGPCGFHVGAPFESGAAGTLGFEYPVYPAYPHQVCRVTVAAQPSLSPVSGGSYTNVAGNLSITTLTFDFTGGPLPLGMLWLWAGHCADPPAPGILTVTVDGQSSSSGTQAAESCFPDHGGSSGLGFDSAVGIQPDPYVAVGMASTTDGHGYWTVFASGPTARAQGDAAAEEPFPSLVNAPVVGMAANPAGQGYWAVAADGGVFSFGGAGFYGSTGGLALNAPVVGMAATPNGGGYWLVAADGGIFSFGDASFHGSEGGTHLNAPVVGMAATPDGGGYWLAAYDGGVFALGDAAFYGSAGNVSLAAPVTAMAGTPSGHGYWLLGADGGIFAYGDARFYGATLVGSG